MNRVYDLRKIIGKDDMIYEAKLYSPRKCGEIIVVSVSAMNVARFARWINDNFNFEVTLTYPKNNSNDDVRMSIHTDDDLYVLWFDKRVVSVAVTRDAKFWIIDEEELGEHYYRL